MALSSQLSDLVFNSSKKLLKRRLTPSEFQLIRLLEDVASHGLDAYWDEYSLDHIHLGKRGIWRILITPSERLLVGRIYPPRLRVYLDRRSRYL